jgi:hypothetical protein
LTRIGKWKIALHECQAFFSIVVSKKKIKKNLVAVQSSLKFPSID